MLYLPPIYIKHVILMPACLQGNTFYRTLLWHIYDGEKVIVEKPGKSGLFPEDTECLS